ncbi:hypothetical protein SBV1_10011 [Verrucomicrobia bacterium]|nr:hypothetical protein SBV1_10011 [Verrucomicrobiota bacterium]
MVEEKSLKANTRRFTWAKFWDHGCEAFSCPKRCRTRFVIFNQVLFRTARIYQNCAFTGNRTRKGIGGDRLELEVIGGGSAHLYCLEWRSASRPRSPAKAAASCLAGIGRR